ncbi:unnamed protein product [Adineta steineri]|uniref:C2H2-type domain-containing protein n=2 Tax=Adineta steineri TaxID=433720 RepID=A0A815HZF4_9BILA|nr:unnamed protein product [Adineta steineri]
MSQLHYFCPLCESPNVFQNYPKLFAHIRDEHREESPFSIRCELGMMCGSRYSSYDSYRRHIYRCHRSLLDSLDNNDTILSDDISDSIEDLFSDLTFDDPSQDAGDPDSSIYPDEEIDELDRLFSSFDSISSSSTDQQLNFDKLAQFYTYFLLELREHHLLPQKIVQLISSNICKLFDMIIKLIKTKASSTTSLLSVTAYENAFAHITSMINSISKNEYQFLKRCKKHFSYEPPVEIILDQPNEHAYYIPLKKSLSYTLQDGQLLQAIIDNINSLSNRAAQDKDLVLSNRQGHFVKTNLYGQTNSNVLLLKLYTDGISITNPIGPHRDSHKLTCFYYLLDDLPEVIRSQVNSIGLHCICYTKHLNNDNSRTILTNVLVEDINKLQTDGITIPCLSSRIYFVFSSVCGDNLASNEVGGFQKSFSSGSFCRHCFITYEQKHIPLTDISFVPRTRLKHDFILNQVILNNGRQIIQGVKGPSWFKDLIGFHPTESLPPDVMHDFSEAHRENENLLVMVNQMNMELLKDDPNNQLLHDLWIQSFNIRRLCIRELDIVEILERFPGYRRSEMILAEVKESTGIDIEENVNVLLPKFFDHVPDNNCFLSDVLPIRVIRVLCKLFSDTVANIFTYEEVLTPGPCMKILDNKFELYLDFHLVTHTSSFSQALALLTALYYVFEIRFGHHNRCCRLLYGILFEDSHYLNKALKNLLNSWKYKVVNRSFVRRQVVVTNLVGSLTQPSTTNEHVSSPSDISNEIAQVSPEQSRPDQYTSSQLNVTISRNIDEENISEIDEDDFTQPSAAVEDDIYQSSTTTRQALAPLTNSSITIQNKSAALTRIQGSSLNLNSKELDEIHASRTSLLAQQCENEVDSCENPAKSSSTVTRKRRIRTPRSSSSISTPKSSARLEAKRARLQ